MGRSFFVVVNGYQSAPQIITSGVPQGSHLGPILFNYFINDISHCFHHADIFMYADDLKAVKLITSREDVELLQSDLNRLVQWCQHNQMNLNPKKCYHVTFSRKSQNNLINAEYFIDQELINKVDTIRDLGVTFDKKLTFVPHVDNIVKSASKMLGFVLRTCRSFRNNKTKILLYNCLVRNILEYCSVVWRPHYATHSLRLERIQKRFVWHLAFSNGLAKKMRAYNSRLKYFGMKSLANRRQINDAVFACKIFAHKVESSKVLALFKLRVPHRVPRVPITPLCPPFRRTASGANSPCSRLCKIINSCSDNLDLHSDTFSKQKSILSNLIQLESNY